MRSSNEANNPIVVVYIIISVLWGVFLGVVGSYTNTHFLIILVAGLVGHRFLYKVLFTRR